MRIAFTHNLRLTDSEEEAEFDTAETVDAIAEGLRAGGHEVEKIEVTGPASHLAARIEIFGPDLIFNNAEGRRGRTREAFYPALFEELGFPYTGSDAYVLTVTLDKWLTKLVLAQRGIDTPRGRLVTPDELKRLKDPGTLGLALPVIVKPNYEGSSKGIGDDAVVRDAETLAEAAAARAALVPERRAGRGVRRRHRRDRAVPRGPRRRRRAAAGRLRRRALGEEPLQPLRLPPQVGRVQQGAGALPARPAARRDVAPAGARQAGDARAGHPRRRARRLPPGRGRAHLSAGGQRAAVAGARRQHVRRGGARGADYAETLQAIVESAARRQGLVIKPGARRRRPPSRCASASPSTSSASTRRAATTPRPSTTRPRPSTRSARRWRATATRLSVRGDRRAAAAADGDAGRPGLQHRRGRRGPKPRGGRARAVRAARHPLHGLRRGNAVDRARQGAVEARAHAARDPHRGVPGHGDRARAPVAQAEVPADREAEPGGLVEGRERVGLGRRRRRGPARRGARADRALPAAGAHRGLHPRARVHRGPARRSAPARAAADGDPVQGQDQRSGRSTTSRSSRSGRSTSATSAPRS